MDSVIVFDIETELIKTPNVLPERVHMVAGTEPGDAEPWYLTSWTAIHDWWVLEVCREDVTLVGHNIARFDIPVMEALTGIHFPGRIIDTLLWSRWAHGPYIVDRTFEVRGMRMKAAGVSDFAEQDEIWPTKLCFQHSLESWGYRLMEKKASHHIDDVETFFAKLTPEMVEYCCQDVRLNAALFEWLRVNEPAEGMPVLTLDQVGRESRLAWIVAHQERNGIGIDVDACRAALVDLGGKQARTTAEIRERYPGWWAPAAGQPLSKSEDFKVLPSDAKFTAPARHQNRRPGTKLNPHTWPIQIIGPYTKVAWVETNPNSPAHVGKLLQAEGWAPAPDQHTEKGAVSVAADILREVHTPTAPLFAAFAAEQMKVQQLNQWAELERAGIIRGSVDVVGARTTRMTHREPNSANIDRTLRYLFRPTRPGWVQVGADAAGLELRMLGHRLEPFDKGALIHEVIQGDVHSVWQEITGMPSRDGQKTFTYALFYGAGPDKLGRIYVAACLEEGVEPGPFPVEWAQEAKARLLEGVVGLQPLLDQLQRRFRRGWLRGLDGRPIPMMSEHARLNDLLQSDGAVVMKRALEILWEEHGCSHGHAWAMMANVHDEWQVEAMPTFAETIGQAMVDAIVAAGEVLGVRCPLDGAYKIGNTWAETH